MALYFYFNETTGDLVYSDKATYDVDGYTSVGEQTDMNPERYSHWIFDSIRSSMQTVSKDPAIVDKITGLTSMAAMFNKCSNLTSIDLSGFDTSAVTDMGNMFGSCNKLTSLDLSDFDTSAVTSMGNMFQGCGDLTSLDLSSFDTSAVTNMYRMFYDCGLTSLNLSSFNTAAVTDMSNMFRSCTHLTSLDLSSFDTSSVTKMDNMFYYCLDLVSLDLSSFNTVASTNMYCMFRDCKSLTSLDLSGFNTAAVVNVGNMFSGCSNLINLDLSNFNISTETNVQYIFSGCDNLHLIAISNKMLSVLSQLPADQYYPASGGDPVSKADLTAGTWVRDEADLSMVTSIVAQAQMSQAISRRIGKLNRDLRAEIAKASAGSSTPSVDVVRTDAHSTSYTKDTLEIVTDSSGKVTAMYFVAVD